VKQENSEKSISPFKQNFLLTFFTKAIILYSSWFIFYYVFLEPKTTLDENFITHIIKCSEFILKVLNFKTFIETEDRAFQLIGIVGGDSNPGVWVGTGCNAITLFALFSIFIISFPGKIKNKIWFIPLGLFVIHIANIIRVCSLAIIAYYNYNLLNFNHTYTFTILVYSVIFLLWVWWVKKFSFAK
jgi:exosortase family protein XrtF